MIAAQYLALQTILGMFLGLGVWLITPMAKPKLGSRLARRVGGHLGRGETSQTLAPGGFFGLLSGILGRGQGLFERALGRKTQVERWIIQAGLNQDVRSFRVRQLNLTLLVLAIALAVFSVLSSTGQVSFWLLLAGPPAAALAAVLVSERWLKFLAARRLKRILAQFPSVIEFLSLCLAAGEGLSESIRRVCANNRGDLVYELRRVLAGVSSGETIETELKRLASRLGLPAVDRAITQILAALERGTPLASVLITQAGEARHSVKLALIESAGRKEIGMMLPLVFFILPVTILFAVFPGLQVLQLGN